jgi:hypothetical protein
MNKIITTDVVDPAIQQPFTANSLDFLQNATKESLLALAATFLGNQYDLTKPYVLLGLYAYGTGNYQEGFVLWGGEIYYCAGKSDSVAMVNIPVLTITVTNDGTADPVQFTDLTFKNVHNVRRLVLSDALTGTGTFDLSTAIHINRWISYTPTFAALDSAGSTVVGGATIASTSFQYIYKGDRLSIVGSCSFQTLAGVRQVTISLPFALPSSPASFAKGTGAAKLFKSATASIPAVANISLNSAGAGDALNIEKLDGSDFGAISGYTLRFAIDIAIVY